MKEHKGFCLDIQATIHMTLEDIWPDGDAPENPTAQDVEKVIKTEGGLRAVLRDWDLEDSLEMTIEGNNTFATVLR